MAINWYPGHMHKARKQMEEVLPNVDLIIEVLDARIPFSSENPMINRLRQYKGMNKPCIKVLSKSDLADPEVTQLWVESLEKEQGVKALPLTTDQPSQAMKLLPLCRSLFPEREQNKKPIHTMIMGIPNVGKSTLINTLAGRIIAKVGNEPAVTKRQQRIDLGNGVILSDTPGILWPKIDIEDSGYRLATTGAIRDTAMDYDDVAFFAVEYLMQAYPELLKARYQFDALPEAPMQLLEQIGRNRGCLRGGGGVDLNKVSTLVIKELRAGTIGRISMETPILVEQDKLALERILAEKEEKKAARKKAFKEKRRQQAAAKASRRE